MGRVHIVVLLIVTGVVAVGLGGNMQASAADGTTDMELVRPVENGSELWPYTSQSRSVHGRTLAVNLVVRGDPTRVREYFRRHSDGSWSRRPHPVVPDDGRESVLPVDDGVVWQEGHASPRYTFIAPTDGNEEGVWVDEAYELFDGPYLGSRYHVRTYVPPTPGEGWTAMQAHHEYWDWFRLRHTVTSVAEAQRYVEGDLRGRAPIEPMRRQYLGTSSPLDGSGWVTVVKFIGIFALLGSLRSDVLGLDPVRKWFSRGDFVSTSREGSLRFLLLVSLPVLYMSVRVGAIAVESAVPTVSPKVIIAFLYPILVLSIPVAADRFSRGLDPRDASVHAVLALAGAFLLDQAYLELSVVPVGLLLHRVSLVLSVGVLAAGAAVSATGGDRWNVLRILGLAGWLLGLAFGLVGIA